MLLGTPNFDILPPAPLEIRVLSLGTATAALALRVLRRVGGEGSPKDCLPSPNNGSNR